MSTIDNPQGMVAPKPQAAQMVQAEIKDVVAMVQGLFAQINEAGTQIRSLQKGLAIGEGESPEAHEERLTQVRDQIEDLTRFMAGLHQDIQKALKRLDKLQKVDLERANEEDKKTIEQFNKQMEQALDETNSGVGSLVESIDSISQRAKRQALRVIVAKLFFPEGSFGSVGAMAIPRVVGTNLSEQARDAQQNYIHPETAGRVLPLGGA